MRGSTLTAGNDINIKAQDNIGIAVEADRGYKSSYVYKKDSSFTGGLSGMSFGVSYQQTKDRIKLPGNLTTLDDGSRP
ncbi:MAG: hypothetical protein IPP74_04525 [Alphaproteobacteria bacterium]|nr:hypothetical protein [Alphaproteobacteria bacterium]